MKTSEEKIAALENEKNYYRNLACEILGAVLAHGDLSKFGTENCIRWQSMLR
jgi:hypothetical protein